MSSLYCPTRHNGTTLLTALTNSTDYSPVPFPHTHLAGGKASPELTHDFLEEVARRLRRTGYNVWLPPFGYVCEWELSAYGESLAKAFKEI
jgi:hypothetical protein